MTNQKINRSERPDKSLFLAMMGAFFIFFSLPAFYWGFYSFQNYRQNLAHVGTLREKDVSLLTPKERDERESLIRTNTASASRNLLEAGLIGAGGFVLFGIAIVLFDKARRSRKRKNFYGEIDPRVIPILPAPLEIRYKKLSDVLFAAVLLFFGAFLLLVIYQTFTSKFMTTENAVIRSLIFAAPMLFLVIIFSFLKIRAKRNAVKTFDASSIIRGDGRRFAWQEFRGVITQTARSRFAKKYVWREELAFSDGETAWLIPHRVKNADEVFNYFDRLPRAVLKN